MFRQVGRFAGVSEAAQGAEREPAGEIVSGAKDPEELKIEN